MTYYKDLVHHL